MSKYSGALARRYGTALFETLISTSKNKTDFEKSVEHIRLISSFCSKKIISSFTISSLTNEEKLQTLEYFLLQILKKDEIAQEIKSFLKLVLVNKRFSDIKPILNFFFKKADEYLNIARATVISARPLQEQEITEFESSLQKALNKKIVLKTKLDESLKSGFVIKLGHVNIDACLKSRLNGLKELFI